MSEPKQYRSSLLDELMYTFAFRTVQRTLYLTCRRIIWDACNVNAGLDYHQPVCAEFCDIADWFHTETSEP